jgi:two-component system nitrogen regulation sensor histidine kinase GlnL
MSISARVLTTTSVIPEGRAILDALPSPLLALDAGDAIAFANSAAEGFFHASAAQLKRMSLQDVVPFASPLHRLIAQVRTSQATVNEYGVTIGTPRTGGERTVDLQAAAVPETPGMVILILQQRSMAQKLDRQLIHRGAARAVSGLATMLAHEIKNPLSGIRGAAQLIEPALAEEEDRALARLIRAEADRIRCLVDQMEVFSDERPLARQPVNIHSVLDHVRGLARSGFAHGIAIRDEYDPSLPPVFGHRDQLVQVFINLVKNAAESIAASGKNGEIVLTTAYRPGVRLTVPGGRERVTLPLEVCVHDTGPGVPEDVVAHIFDPFVTSKPGGKGLGLALVAKIIRDHGGVAECETGPRRTTFRILLPMVSDPLASSRSRS